jgi:rSAM/selenodomain-associated transferase 2
MSLHDISIVIPIAPGESAWPALLGDLRALPAEAEIVLAATEPPPSAWQAVIAEAGVTCATRWVVAARGRGPQLNAGARAASKTFVWFLHADSRLPGASLAALERALLQQPGALHYFNLAFANDGPFLMRLNAAGTWLRSHALGMPFGDQGFCLRRERFEALGGYPEDLPYGEDHVFVWTARRQRIPLRCTGAPLFTSARKYRERGWLRTTLRHLVLTAKQAAPELGKLLASRLPKFTNRS